MPVPYFGCVVLVSPKMPPEILVDEEIGSVTCRVLLSTFIPTLKTSSGPNLWPHPFHRKKTRSACNRDGI